MLRISVILVLLAAVLAPYAVEAQHNQSSTASPPKRGEATVAPTSNSTAEPTTNETCYTCIVHTSPPTPTPAPTNTSYMLDGGSNNDDKGGLPTDALGRVMKDTIYATVVTVAFIIVAVLERLLPPKKVKSRTRDHVFSTESTEYLHHLEVDDDPTAVPLLQVQESATTGFSGVVAVDAVNTNNDHQRHNNNRNSRNNPIPEVHSDDLLFSPPDDGGYSPAITPPRSQPRTPTRSMSPPRRRPAANRNSDNDLPQAALDVL